MRKSALVLGLNLVDPAAYGGWDGVLAGCCNDANSIADLLHAADFDDVRVLKNQEATVRNVKSQLLDFAKLVEPGDLFVLFRSSHGGQIADLTGDECDGLDETACLYDGMIVDDELYSIIGQFKAGVRVLVITDACHAETGIKGKEKSRALKRFSKSYKRVRKNKDPEASIIEIAACSETGTACDGDKNGLFTGALLTVWDSGSFAGGHKLFARKIGRLIHTYQTVKLNTYGKLDMAFLVSKPFCTIE